MSPRPFTARCRDAVETSDLRPGARHLYHVLATFADHQSGECHPSLAKLSAVTGMAKSTLLRHVAALAEAGLMTFVAGRGRGNRTAYTLTPDGAVKGSATQPLKGSEVQPFSEEEKVAFRPVKGSISPPPYKDLEDPIEDPSTTPQRGNGQPPHSPDRQLPVNSPLQPLPPAGNKQWETLLPAHELNIPATRGEYLAICSALRHRGALAEFRKARKKLLASKSRDGKVWWSEQVDLAQRIGAEWEERAAATRPDPRAELLAYEQEKIDRRRAAARGEV